MSRICAAGIALLDHVPPGHRHDRQERTALHKRYDRRAAYASVPQQRATTATSASMAPRLRGRSAAPTTRPRCGSRTPGAGCACGKTFTLAPTATPWTQQRSLWGTTAWARDYGRCSAVESVNAEVNTHRLHPDRGFARVHGAPYVPLQPRSDGTKQPVTPNSRRPRLHATSDPAQHEEPRSGSLQNGVL